MPVQTSTTRRPSPRIKDGEGALLLVPPRTPRSSEYDVYAHAVYVVICYMSITGYVRGHGYPVIRGKLH